MNRLIPPLILILLIYSTSLSGQEYFQQEVDYTIHVTLDDQRHFLTGHEKIQYTNNSPEELDFLYFHLWPNAYKNNQTALAKEQFRVAGRQSLFKMESQRGFIDSLNFQVNGKNVKWEFHPKHQDICKIILNDPLQSGETITITTPFRVKIPHAVTSRMGHMGQAYKITQWFPKPAVYDHKGWHPMPYLDMGEFYSEFGSFDVTITLPKNYVVAASGSIQSKEEKKWLNQKAEQTKRTLNYNPGEMEIPLSSDELKTIRFTQDNAHDFAWFADKRYHVAKDSVQMPGSKEKILTWAFYTNDQAGLWRNATEYMNSAIKAFSKWYGNYPYKTCKAVSGFPGGAGQGMEYPGITIIGETNTALQFEEILVHEIAHNWFYGMLGFNERRYPFLDEGLTTFSEFRYMNHKYQGEKKLYETFGFSEFFASITGIQSFGFADINDLMYLFRARKNLDQPLNTASTQFFGSNYFTMSYGKSSRSFQYLMSYLGDRAFNEVMQEFTSKWRFKHPYPKDLENSFEETTGKDLDWLFHGLMETSQKMDYSVKRYQDNEILIKNKGNVGGPVHLEGTKLGETVFSIWEEGFTGKKWIKLPQQQAEKIIIDPDRKMLELYRRNNRIRTKGVLKKVEPLKVNFAGLFKSPEYTQIHYFPALGWNFYDKMMPGLLLYDAPFPPDKFDYYLAPFFSTGNSSFAGTGYMNFNFYPQNLFNRIQLSFSGKTFSISDIYPGQYQKIHSGIKLDFNKNHQSATNRIKLEAFHVTDVKIIEDRILKRENQELSFNNFIRASFIQSNLKKSINPYEFSANLEAGKGYIKSWLEGEYKISYYLNEGLTIRLFGGSFLRKPEDLAWNYAFYLSGQSGLNDYLYEGTYLGRFEPPQYGNAIRIFTQQYYPKDGGFALYSPLGITQDWLASVNLESSLPLIEEIPIFAYAGMGAFGKMKDSPVTLDNKSWAWESGLKLSFLNIVDVYFPVLSSQNLKKTSDFYSATYGEKIRFYIKFDLLNPSRIADQFNF